jgi:hypothetical protein
MNSPHGESASVACLANSSGTCSGHDGSEGSGSPGCL